MINPESFPVIMVIEEIKIIMNENVNHFVRAKSCFLFKNKRIQLTIKGQNDISELSKLLLIKSIVENIIAMMAFKKIILFRILTIFLWLGTKVSSIPISDILCQKFEM